MSVELPNPTFLKTTLSYLQSTCLSSYVAYFQNGISVYNVAPSQKPKIILHFFSVFFLTN